MSVLRTDKAARLFNVGERSIKPNDDAPTERIEVSEVIRRRDAAFTRAEVIDEDWGGPRSLPMSAGRYEITRELARGGMGEAFQGVDPYIGREVAVKVLLADHCEDDHLTRRFIEEAQIGGQLQHPSILPVYDLGRLEDNRPFFAMKLVRGRTLRDLIKESTDLERDLPRFLSIFEQTCQAMAYAHARGVIHRDLKPSNVMVGAFGEVQVMDWGLAKVVGARSESDSPSSSRTGEDSDVRTLRSDSDLDASTAGSVIGTPAYMAPEQAQGDVNKLDARVDVFGLGAILCEILTGAPAYIGKTRPEVLRKATQGDLKETLARLSLCPADGELVRLCRDCLAPRSRQRPADAGAVVERLTSYRITVAERLRTAEMARVEAEARADEERRRRRLSLALLVSMLATVVLGGAGWIWVAAQRAERRTRTALAVNTAIDEATVGMGRSLGARPNDLSMWPEAAEDLRRAAALLANGEADDRLRRRLAIAENNYAASRAEALKRKRRWERDQSLFADLETIRGRLAEHVDLRRTDADYSEAFRAAGFDPDRQDPIEVGQALSKRDNAPDLAAAIDDWARVRKLVRRDDPTSWRRLFQAARAADPDPWRERVRDAVEEDDVKTMNQLAGEANPAIEPVQSIILLSSSLMYRGRFEAAAKLLKASRRYHPGDYWINNLLATAVRGVSPPRLDDAIRYATAASSLRPNSPHALAFLGTALREAGSFEEAVDALQQAVRLKPDHSWAYSNLGFALEQMGDLDGAIAEYEKALVYRSDDPHLHENLGYALRRKGSFSKAVQALRKAAELAVVDPRLRENLLIELALTERLNALGPLWLDFVRGTTPVKNAPDALAVARLAYDQRRFAAASRLWQAAFQLDPSTAADMHGGYRYNAACAAVMAGCGQGTDDPPPDESTRVALRLQGLQWLRDDLESWRLIITTGVGGYAIRTALKGWNADRDLVGVRSNPAIENLPESERTRWRDLWREHDVVLKSSPPGL